MAKKTSKHARKQPQLKRAPSKFQQVIPCRESILKAMSVLGKPAKLDELIHKLDAQPSQIEGLERRVKAMIRDGQLVKNRTGRLAVTKNMNLVKGKARMHRKGSLFLDLLEPHRADYPGIIPTFTSLQAREVMHDDVVLVRLVPLKQKGEYRVVLVDVISRGYDRLIGLCIQRHGLHYLETSQRLYTGTVLIDEASIKSDSCREGEYCLAKIKHYPSRYQDCIVQLEHHLGDHTKAGLERELVIHSFNLPAVFPDEVMSEAKVLAQTQIKPDQYRDDWRSLPFVTIDGSDARDFDDAICVQSHDKGWTVRVAIADVSAFVTLGSAIDQEAQRRATSVYLPGSVIPMLPEVLCNDLCSLKPQVDRWVLGITIHMDKRLVVSDVTMHKAIIHSHARLIYEDAADMMTQVEQTQDPNKWQTMIHDAYRLYQSLLLKRRRRGALEIELPQPKVVFNEYRKIQGFIQESRTVAHKVIEELMLLANEQTALFMQRHGISGVYRNHVKPDAKRLEALLPLLETYGINVSKNKRLTPHLMQTIVDEVSALPNKTIIMPMVLSCMAQAEYQTHNLGHFGLAYKQYCHFTSPIRRYPDLMVHRAISHFLEGKPGVAMSAMSQSQCAKHSSNAERRADEASRYALNWLKCEAISSKMGERLWGTVTSVKPFGMFVMLDDVFVDGMLHISQLPNDYYRYDAQRHELLGESSQRCFKLGDRVCVMIDRIDVLELQIDFKWVVEK